MEEPIENLANAWLQLDHDPITRAEIEDLLQQNDAEELERRLRKRIAFGTAGLRSSMKAGFAHMNSLTVLQASQGLAQYIIEQDQTDPDKDESNGTGTKQILSGPSKRLSVVIGYDARHNSEKFARLTAAAFLAKGFRVLWFGHLVHTPLVPFSVKHYGASAGVMVTASHNPKADNGYKVYWSNGCQIIPPHDAGIARAIDEVHFILSWDTTQVDSNPLVEHIAEQAAKAYFEALRTQVADLLVEGEPMRFTYTPMHGVGLPFMKQAARMLGFSGEDMKVVAAQAEPDPEFPTVPFPNPEEKGALDLAIEEAERDGSPIILANDPDADRFAVAERVSDGEKKGKWHQFTGNQMGVLLASHIFETYLGNKSSLAMLASTVSSRMLASMAAKEGFKFQETLTGFKWLGNVAQDLEHEGVNAVYAYEEAIGYMFSKVVWDKDGITAAAVFLTAWRRWAAQGLTPWKKLQQLYEKYGYFEDANTYLISPSPDMTNKVFDDIRVSNAGSRPQSVGQRKIYRWRDLTTGFDTASADNKPDLPIDASAQMITCELDNVVFTARGSGTEPKIKLYIEAKADSSAQARKDADSVLADLLKEWFKPEYKLKLAGA